MMLLAAGSKLIDNGEYEKAMPFFVVSSHIVTSQSQSPSGIITDHLASPPLTKLAGLIDNLNNNQSLEPSSLKFASQPIDMYMEDAEDVGPRMFRKALVLPDSVDSSLLQLVISYYKAIIYHATQEVATASDIYQWILSMVNLKFNPAGPCIPPEWLHLAMCVCNNLGQIYYTQRCGCMSISHFERAVQLGRAIIGPSEIFNYNLDFVDVLSNWCRSKYTNGVVYGTDTCIELEEILRIRTALLSWDHVDVASAHFNLGVAEYLRNNDDKATSHLRHYLKITSHHADQGIKSGLDPLPGLIYLLLNEHDGNDNELSEDLVWRLRSLQDMRAEVGPQHHEVAACLNYIGRLLFQAKEPEHALMFLLEELRIEENLDASLDRFGISVTCNNIGRILQELKRFPQAIEYYEKAIARDFGFEEGVTMVSGCQPANSNPVAMNLYSTVWYNLGLIHDNMGAHGKATEAFQTSLQLRRGMLGPDHADIACLAYNIGVLQMEQRMLRDAAGSFREALRIRDIVPAGQLTDLQVVTTLRRLASLQKARGDVRDALETCREVVRILQRSREFKGRYARAKLLGSAHRDVAELHHAVGNLDVALDSASKSVEALMETSGGGGDEDDDAGGGSTGGSAGFWACVEESVTSLLLVGCLQHELCEPVRGHACFCEAVRVIQDNCSNKQQRASSASLLPLIEVSRLLRSNHCAAKA